MDISEGEFERRMVFARQEVAKAWCTPEASFAEVLAKLLVHHMYEPHLGCATTGEIFDELRARYDGQYKTVKDSEKEVRKDE